MDQQPTTASNLFLKSQLSRVNLYAAQLQLEVSKELGAYMVPSTIGSSQSLKKGGFKEGILSTVKKHASTEKLSFPVPKSSSKSTTLVKERSPKIKTKHSKLALPFV